MEKYTRRRAIAGVAAIAALASVRAPVAFGASPTVVEITQTACQFVEAEGSVDHGFTSRNKAECEAINERTGDSRYANAGVLELPPGQYVFRVTNQDVPYELGFFLRGAGLLDRIRLPSVGGRGVGPGETKDFPVALVAGEYAYSCPLNPTLDYRLVVTERRG